MATSTAISVALAVIGAGAFPVAYAKARRLPQIEHSPRERQAGPPKAAGSRYGVNGGAGFGWRAAGAACALLCSCVWGFGPAAVLAFAFLSILAAVAAIDRQTRLIPNSLVAALAAVGAVALGVDLAAHAFPTLGMAVLAPVPLRTGAVLKRADPAFFASSLPAGTALFPYAGLGAAERIAGAFAASAPMLAAAAATNGFGGGDVKLLAAIGLCLGWRLVLLTLVGAMLSGGLYGVFLVLGKGSRRTDTFAFGPFICAAAAIACMGGPALLHFCLSAMGWA